MADLEDRLAVPFRQSFVAPVSPLEKALARLWSEVLGVGRVGLHDGFSALGGDAGSMARMVASLEARLTFAVDTTELPETFTVAELAAILHEPDRIVLPVRTTGRRKPLVVVHGAGADVLFAYRMAAILGEDQPVYAIRPQPLTGPASPFSDLSEFAGYYLQQMADTCGTMNYRLFGFSLGGCIAFEMALNLQRSGSPVAQLLLGDPPSPAELAERARPKTAREILVRRARNMRKVVQSRAAATLGRVPAEQARDAAHKRRSNRAKEKSLQAWRRTGGPPPPELDWRANRLVWGALVNRWQPDRLLQSPCVFLSASGTSAARVEDWAKRCSLPLQTAIVHAPHDGMIREPGVLELCDLISKLSPE